MDRFYFLIRKITVAPVMAGLMLIILMQTTPKIFPSAVSFSLSLVFL